MKVAEALKEFEVKVVYVTAYARLRLVWPEGGKWPGTPGEIREKLESLKVKIVEETAGRT